MVAEGETAPDFTLEGTDGEEIREYSLSEALGEGHVVLSFYVYDFSPICESQMCDIDDVDLFQFEERVSTLGVAPDGVYAHRQFHAEAGLSYPLLSDRRLEVAQAYDVYDEETGDATRSLFLIEPDGAVSYRWTADDNEAAWSTSPVSELRERLGS